MKTPKWKWYMSVVVLIALFTLGVVATTHSQDVEEVMERVYSGEVYDAYNWKTGEYVDLEDIPENEAEYLIDMGDVDVEFSEEVEFYESEAEEYYYEYLEQ